MTHEFTHDAPPVFMIARRVHNTGRWFPHASGMERFEYIQARMGALNQIHSLKGDSNSKLIGWPKPGTAIACLARSRSPPPNTL